MPLSAVFGIAVALVAVSIVLGQVLSKLWRMPDYSGKISLVLFSFIAGLVVSYLGWPPKLSIDLRGGVILVYEILNDDQAPGGNLPDQPDPAAGKKKVDMDKLIGAIIRRVNPGGVSEVTVRAHGPGEIEVIVPEADEAEAARMEKMISTVGSLEFRILANPRDPDHKTLITRSETLSPDEVQLRSSDGKQVLAWWVPVEEKQQSHFPGSISRQVTRKGIQMMEILVVKDQYDVTGDYLASSRASYDQKGMPSVDFGFNPAGAQRFGALTTKFKPNDMLGTTYQLGIILNNLLSSAPNIQSPIFERGQITGSFTQQEVQDLVNVLNAGSLPATLSKEPISKLFIGPTLGTDTIERSLHSMVVSLVVVSLFMLIYYRFSGVVANLALLMNMVLLLAFMVGIKAAFSLPGLAGFALTIGMAVDSNVLIYERIREERDRGAALRMAIRNGFDRAFSAIFDSHLTTLISAAVLYGIGTDQIKGFAITLFLGVAINLYTAVFCVHVVFDVAEKQNWIKELKMMRMFTKADFDFWGLRYKCYIASILITVLGLVAVAARGKGLLDIDFTGGVSIQMVFKDAQDINMVRHALEKQGLPDLVVQDVVKKKADEQQREYVINTSSLPGVDATEYLHQVEDKLKAAFGEKLQHNNMAVRSVMPIAAAAAGPEAAKTEVKKDTTPEAVKPEVKKDTAPVKPEPKKDTSAEAKKPDPKKDVKPEAKKEPAPEAMKPEVKKDAAPEAAKPEPKKDAPAEAKKPEVKKEAAPEAKKDKPPTPDKKSQSRRQLSESTMLASADPDAVLLAMADTKKDEPKKDEAAKPAPATTEPAKTTASSAELAKAEKEKQANRFAGGTEATIHFDRPLNHDAVEALVVKQVETMHLGNQVIDHELSARGHVPGEKAPLSDWTLKIKLSADNTAQLLDAVGEQVKGQPFFPQSNTIGGKVASDTQYHAIWAIIVSNVLIALYLWIRFQRLSYGVAAVVALLHDVLVALGFLAVSYYIAPLLSKIGLGFLMLEPFKIGMTEVAAFLTIVGYSVSDTVVVFDRIREVRGKSPDVTPQIINASINQTLSRTILTSLTAWLVVVVLYFMGGPTIHGFAFAMIIGIITGTYSSIYVAPPLLLLGTHHDRAPTGAVTEKGSSRN